jgi:hypothetical protein
MARATRKELEKITVDRKIVEGLRDGQSVTALTKATGKGKGYVIKIRDLAAEYGYIATAASESKYPLFTCGPKPMPAYPEALFPCDDGRSRRVADTDKAMDAHREWVKERLEAGWSPQTIFEELPLAVPRASFYRYLQQHDLVSAAIPRNAMKLVHQPGECLQIDWGKLFDVVDKATGKKKTVWIFVGILGHRRYEMARVVERLDFVTTIEALTSMLEEIGGVPRKVTSDNPKVFVKAASAFEPLLNPVFERMASHYGFTVEALPPVSPELKGKVERMMPVKRRLFESYPIDNYTLESAQAHIDRKLKLTNERRHGTHLQKPIDVFLNDEASWLKSLPVLKYELETIITSRVRADGYVRFDNKYYRIDPCLKRASALVVANPTQVSIYVKGRLIEVYERITEKGITKACKDHLKEPWEKTLNDHGNYLKQAAAVGKSVEQFVNIILARGQGFVDTRVIWGLLTLNKKYTNVDIDKACLSALELAQVNLTTVRQLLNTMAKPKKTERSMPDAVPDRQMGGKFARPMSEYKKHLKLIHSQP